MDLRDRVALVTGGGRGIGRGIAAALARCGADVVAGDINQGEAEETAAAIAGPGRRSLGVRIDVTSQESVDAAVDSVIAEFGRIDILVNNAGIIGAPRLGGAGRVHLGRLGPDLRGQRQGHSARHERRDRSYETAAARQDRQHSVGGGEDRDRDQRSVQRVQVGSHHPHAGPGAGAGPIRHHRQLDLPEPALDADVGAYLDALDAQPRSTRGLTPRQIFDSVVRDRIPLGREQTPEDIGNLAASSPATWRKTSPARRSTSAAAPT